ncbi:jg14053 [Pararge aegeria aegeria]|uniref:Jg14053 protein n=1 Tax=Pararge aegeria aegeria TaxID=348720 RepID=A0A8S4QP47_9NEOP|nr:jg14053 [Pararge aegeria aegeria]
MSLVICQGTHSAILGSMASASVSYESCGARCVRSAYAKRTALFTRAAAATETSRQHTRLSQTTHSCDSEAQRGSCIAHLNATLMSESV